MLEVGRVAIVGAGIAGLAVAHALIHSKLSASIRIYSDEDPSYTTSTVAGGLIEPAYIAADDPRIGNWFTTSRALFASWLAEPRWHVLRASVRILWRQIEPPPAWADLVDDFVTEPRATGPYTHTWRFNTEVIEVPRHIAELLRQLAARGISITHRKLRCLDELYDEADVIINCSGVGARLLGDPSVSAISGQVVVLERDATVPAEVVIDEDPLTYVIPRNTDIVVGGTFVVEDFGRVPHVGVAEAMLRRATQLVPRLARARVLAHRVGLRPARPRPRLEIETATASGPLIAHCYGTGGAGIGLAHGMAQDLVSRIAGQLPSR